MSAVPTSTAPPASSRFGTLSSFCSSPIANFTGDPDDVLAKLRFGRAHHRVLHFVNRNPGMKVAELLDILKITKQSLGRVLRPAYCTRAMGLERRRQ